MYILLEGTRMTRLREPLTDSCCDAIKLCGAFGLVGRARMAGEHQVLTPKRGASSPNRLGQPFSWSCQDGSVY
jgi:hypothetical protein